MASRARLLAGRAPPWPYFTTAWVFGGVEGASVLQFHSRLGLGEVEEIAPVQGDVAHLFLQPIPSEGGSRKMRGQFWLVAAALGLALLMVALLLLQRAAQVER